MMYVYSRTQKLTYREPTDFTNDLPKLQDQWLKGNVCDINLRICGQNVPAHRGVLCANSPYFERMLTGDFQEKDKNTVCMSESIFSHEALVALVDYMYTGEIEISGDTLENILSGASLFLLESVKGHCAQFMITNLSPVNCIHMWALADLYDLHSVVNTCKDMTKSRFHDFIQHRDEVLDTSGPFFVKLLQEGMLDFLTFEEILNLMSRWIDHQPEDRAKDCITLLHCIAHLDRFKENIVKVDFNHLDKSCASYDDVKEVLSDCLKCTDLQPESSDPELRENAIVSWFFYCTKTYADSHMINVQVHIYRPKLNQWYMMAFDLPAGKHGGRSFIGCSQSKLVFQPIIGQELVLHDMKSGSFQLAPDPRKTLQNDVTAQPLPSSSEYCTFFFVHSKRVLCMVSGNEYEHHSVLMSTERIRMPRMLLALDPTTCTWTKFGELPPGSSESTFIEHKGSMYILSGQFPPCTQYDDNALMYILRGQDPPCTQNYHNALSSHWFKISSKDNSFEVTHLAAPPDTHSSLSGGCLEIQVIGDEIMIGKEANIDKHFYHIPGDTWTSRKQSTLRMPTMKSPLCGAWKKNTRVYLSGDGAGDNKQSGTMYYLEVLCPYICKFWSCEPTEIEEQQEDVNIDKVLPHWQSQMPPSTEKLGNLISCQIPAGIFATMKAASYPDMSEERGQSPLGHCRLPGHTRHVPTSGEIKSGDDFPKHFMPPYHDEQFSDFDTDETDSEDEVPPQCCFVEEYDNVGVYSDDFDEVSYADYLFFN